jgi:hypothetical protein
MECEEVLMIIAIKLSKEEAHGIAEGSLTLKQAQRIFDNWVQNAMIIEPQLPEVEGDIRERTVGELIDAVEKGRWHD